MCNTEQLVSYVYEELSASERVEFERHLSACAGCRQELAELRGTRHLLASWAPPQPEFNFHIVRGAAQLRQLLPALGAVREVTLELHALAGAELFVDVADELFRITHLCGLRRICSPPRPAPVVCAAR